MFGWDGSSKSPQDAGNHRKMIQIFEYYYDDLDKLMDDYNMFNEGMAEFVEHHEEFDYDFTVFIGEGRDLMLEVEVFKYEKRD